MTFRWSRLHRCASASRMSLTRWIGPLRISGSHCSHLLAHPTDISLWPICALGGIFVELSPIKKESRLNVIANMFMGLLRYGSRGFRIGEIVSDRYHWECTIHDFAWQHVVLISPKIILSNQLGSLGRNNIFLLTFAHHTLRRLLTLFYKWLHGQMSDKDKNRFKSSPTLDSRYGRQISPYYWARSMVGSRWRWIYPTHRHIGKMLIHKFIFVPEFILHFIWDVRLFLT